MPNPTLPTRNNWYEFDFLYQFANQLRGIGQQVNPTGLPALPDENPPSQNASGLWYGILQQLKHIGDNWAAVGRGAFSTYANDAAGDDTILASAGVDRVVQIIVEATEAFADGDGGQTAFTIGTGDDGDAFADGSDLVGASLGDKFFYTGVLAADDDLVVGATAATGTGTGAISVSVVAVPEAS